MKLYRIEAPHLSAGFQTRYNVVSDTEPELRWLIGSHLSWVKDCCARKGWKLDGPFPVVRPGSPQAPEEVKPDA